MAQHLKKANAGPYKNNLFSTAVLIATASGLLLNAYESVGRATGDHEYRKAAALVAAILFFQPIRRTTRETPISPELVAINQECAFAAGIELLQISPKQKIHFDLTSFSLVQEIRENLSYLRALENDSNRLIKNNGTALCFSNFPTYEDYNCGSDIRWDSIHEIERIMKTLRLIDYSITPKT